MFLVLKITTKFKVSKDVKENINKLDVKFNELFFMF